MLTTSTLHVTILIFIDVGVFILIYNFRRRGFYVSVEIHMAYLAGLPPTTPHNREQYLARYE